MRRNSDLEVIESTWGVSSLHPSIQGKEIREGLETNEVLHDRTVRVQEEIELLNQAPKS